MFKKRKKENNNKIFFFFIFTIQTIHGKKNNFK
jgi:hypothetical protein